VGYGWEMNDAVKEIVSADPALVTASFRKFTGKRKGTAFVEDGAWWVIDADGHQWCHVEVDGVDTWERFSDDDDSFVRERRAAKRTA